MSDDKKYGNVDILPDDFDPKNGFIAVEFYDKLKVERDTLKAELAGLKAPQELLQQQVEHLTEALKAIGDVPCCEDAEYPGCRSCSAIDVIVRAGLTRTVWPVQTPIQSQPETKEVEPMQHAVFDTCLRCSNPADYCGGCDGITKPTRKSPTSATVTESVEPKPASKRPLCMKCRRGRMVRYGDGPGSAESGYMCRECGDACPDL